MGRKTKQALKLLAILALALATPARAKSRTPRRWVLGVQVIVSPADYRDAKAFEQRLTSAVERALGDRRLAPADQILVVLPEHIGTWLAVAGQKPSVYSARDRTHAIFHILTNDWSFDKALAAAALRERRLKFLDSHFVFSALLRFKSKQMWQTYSQTCSKLAKSHHLTLVCGSIALPALDNLASRTAALHNASYTFGPDGKILHVARKVHLTPEETLFLAAAPLSELSLAQTPMGQVGNMICADGWHEDVYARLAQAEILVQPSFGEGGLSAFDRKWTGYITGPNPPEGRAALGVITERQAWRKFSLAGRIKETRALGGVNPFLAGRLWDIELGGYGVAVRKGAVLSEVMTDSSRDTWLALRLAISP